MNSVFMVTEVAIFNLVVLWQERMLIQFNVIYPQMWHLCPQARHLKTLDTIGNCQRPVFSLGVSQHMHKITSMWKFEHNRASKLRDNNGRKKTLWHEVVWLISRPQILNLRSQNQIRGKLLLSRKLCHFRGSRFSHYSSPSKVLC